MKTRRTNPSASAIPIDLHGVTDQRMRNEDAETRIEQTKARTAHVETRIERLEALADPSDTPTVKPGAELPETHTRKAEIMTELAKTRMEQAEIRTELAKTRTEQAEIRIEQAETRAEQAENALQHVLDQGTDLHNPAPTLLLKHITVHGSADETSLLEHLPGRQREVLQLIAKGRNTKEIASILNISPKTVEYHRMKLMKFLNLHDIPSLVRFALRVGLVPQES